MFCGSIISATSTAMFEAFTADDFDWHTENIARSWVTGYDFPAVRDQASSLRNFRSAMLASCRPLRSTPGSPNSKIRDCDVRSILPSISRSINRDIFYGQYTRIASYFQGTELACSGSATRPRARNP